MRNICIAIACIIVVIVSFVSYYIWFPDVWSHSTRVVAGTTIRSNEAIELTQVWAGDGYMTGVRHTSPSGFVLCAVGNPDGCKIWRCEVYHQTNAAFVRFRFSGNEWKYFYNSHSLNFRGESREAH